MKEKKRSSSTFLEFKLQASICQYLEMQYPDVLFLSDAISNVELTDPQKARNKRIQKKDFSCPDLIIFQPTKTFAGLFLELKAASPYTNEGVLRKQKVEVKDHKTGIVVTTYDHLQEQDRALRKLRNKGYKAEFCWSLDMAIRIINEYMKS